MEKIDLTGLIEQTGKIDNVNSFRLISRNRSNVGGDRLPDQGALPKTRIE
jgi:hypothetical protein